ncbi:MAG: Hpt domain-containing protein [Chloroflexota bacterium]
MTLMHDDLLDHATFASLYELANAGTIVPQIIDLFLSEADAMLREARRALGQGDLAAVAHAAHGLRGGASFVGARQLSQQAKAMEHAADRQCTEEVGRLLELATATLEQTRPLILAALASPPVAPPE